MRVHGSSARLTQNGQHMHLEVLAPAGAAWQVTEMHLEPPQRPLENTRRVWLAAAGPIG